MGIVLRVMRLLPQTLWQAARCLGQHRYLVYQLTLRDIAARYRGSAAGLLWLLLIPLIMLAVYTYMFGMVFKSRWPGAASEDQFQFALLAFGGLIVHMLFADCLARAPTLIVGQPNLVKKVVFPLELLSWSALGTALFHFAVNLAVLVAFALLLNGRVPLTVLWVPPLLLAAVPLLVGLMWFLSSLGVFLRDTAQAVGPLMTILMFTAPIFYPIEAVPAAVQPWLYLNPLTIIVQELRAVTIFGRAPDWSGIGLYLAAGLVVAAFGHLWFRRTRAAFADVI